jgi:progressive ankylosis protein
LLIFAGTVGLVCSSILLLISGTPFSAIAMSWFIGNDPALINQVRPVMLICSIIPLCVAIQNAIQGFLVSVGHTWGVNQATGVGATVMLTTAYLAVQSGQQGAIAAASGMVTGSIGEISYLLYSWRWSVKNQ